MLPRTKGDPYPLYEDIRRRGLVRSPLGPWVTASHATAESVLRDRRFSSSPVHQRGYQPPSFPLPIAVICHLLGVPAEDQASFRAWGHDVAASLEPQTSRAARHSSQSAEVALTGYLRDLVAIRRAEPDDSLLSALIAVEEAGDRLSTAELVAAALLLLVAGFETTVNLIGNGTVALLREPAQWDRLCKEPELAPGAVEELLRYDSPVQMTSRIAMEELTRRFPRLTLAGTPTRRPLLVLRGFDTVPVRAGDSATSQQRAELGVQPGRGVAQRGDVGARREQ